MLTVIIATLNRSKAINEISLPSLLKQDTTDFEVLIWDASEDDLTEKAAESYRNAFIERGVGLRYVRAPRRGSASQRNDAVKEANGDIVFFIDDDSEVSQSGVSAVAAAFEKNEKLYGAALPLELSKTENTTINNSGLLHRILAIVKQLFWKENDYRKVRNSTINTLPKTDTPGIAEWFSGCDMAYRKTVFDELNFDERLEKFGGYALGEDVDLSHRVMLHYGEPLQILRGGSVTHHQAEGGRLDGVKMNAAYFYNFRIIRENFIKYDPRFNLSSFLWEHQFLMVINFYRIGLRLPDITKGYRAYRQAWKELKPANHSKPSALLR